MPARSSRRSPFAVAFAFAALVATGCVHENAPTATGPGPNSTFVGYSNPATQQTTCGNCHVLQAADLVATGHAKAWADLEASGQAAASCDRCHTTNGSSNAGADTAGYLDVSPRRGSTSRTCSARPATARERRTSPSRTRRSPSPTWCRTTRSGRGVRHLSQRRAPRLVPRGLVARGAPGSRGARHQQRRPVPAVPRRQDGGAALRRQRRLRRVRRCEGVPYRLRDVPQPARHDQHRTSCASPITCATRPTSASAATSGTRCPIRRTPAAPFAAGADLPRHLRMAAAGFTWDSTNIPTHANPTANPKLCVTCHVDTWT